MGKKKKTKKEEFSESKKGKDKKKDGDTGEKKESTNTIIEVNNIQGKEEYEFKKYYVDEDEAIDNLPGKYLGNIQIFEGPEKISVYASAVKNEKDEYIIYVMSGSSVLKDKYKYKKYMTIKNVEDLEDWLLEQGLSGYEYEEITRAEYTKAAKEILPGKYIGETEIAGGTFSSYCHTSIEKDEDGIYTVYIVPEYDPDLNPEAEYYDVERFDENEFKEWLEENDLDAGILDDLK